MKALSLLMAVAALGAGCGKHSESEAPPPPAATPPATNSVQAPANPSDAPVAVPGNPSGNAVAGAPAAPNLQQLTLDLHRWIMANERRPRDFEEFAASTKAHIPPPPEGKKFAINSSWKVVLVNR